MPPSIEQKIKFRAQTQTVFTAIENEFTIQPRIALVQSAHESNWGISELAIDGLNIFGMTPGDAWAKAMSANVGMKDVPVWSSLGHSTIFYPTKEYSDLPPEKIHYWDFHGDVVSKSPDGKGGSILVVNRYFRKYSTLEESAWDWARKIAQTPRYALTYEAAKAGDVSAYGAALVKAGYATDPSYQAGLLFQARAVDELPAAA